jgi:hypothetical protein
MGPLVQCTFAELHVASDIYLLHACVPAEASVIVALLSLVWVRGSSHPAGLYMAVSRDGRAFGKPVLLHQCQDYGRRAYDLPVQGSVDSTATGIEFYVHQNVPCRMPSKAHAPEQVPRIHTRLPKYILRLWSEGIVST